MLGANQTKLDGTGVGAGVEVLVVLGEGADEEVSVDLDESGVSVSSNAFCVMLQASTNSVRLTIIVGLFIRPLYWSNISSPSRINRVWLKTVGSYSGRLIGTS